MTSDNNSLGNIPVVSCIWIEIAFNIDKNGIPNMTATNKSSWKQSVFAITKDKRRLWKKWMQQMLNAAEKTELEDEKWMCEMATYTVLVTYAFSQQWDMDDNETKERVSKGLLQNMHAMCETAAKQMDAD